MGNSKTKGARAGFTLVEILVAVAILAIISAALAPLVVKYVNDGRRARAISDCQALGEAVLAFNLDAGRWPVNNDANPNDAGELSRLVGLSQDNISAANIPGGAGVAPGDNSWDGGGSGGVAGALEDQLIFNRTNTVNPLYVTSNTPPEPPGWDGPYLSDVPLDPWGNPYVMNVRYLTDANVVGVTQAEAQEHAVFCLSAGANQLFETSFADATELENNPGGDDVGWLIEGNSNR